DWQVHEAVGRSDRVNPPALLRSVFSMPKAQDKPVYGHFRQPDGSPWLVEQRGVSTPEEALAEADSTMDDAYIAGQTGEQDFAGVQQWLEKEADIERF